MKQELAGIKKARSREEVRRRDVGIHGQLGRITQRGTDVVGKFELSPFFRLKPESLNFLEVFVRNRGNVKEMERETGESYWAIRRQLDEVITEMGFEEPPKDTDLSTQRQEILAQLSRGEINVQEATRLLGQINKN